jgi:hypothetical protein
VPLSHTDATMDVGRRDRRDFGRDRAKTKSWHRSKPLQRCITKTTGLCKTLHLMSVPIWSLLQLRNYADLHFRAVGYNAILAFFLLDADWLIASELSLNLHAALPCQRPGVTP